MSLYGSDSPYPNADVIGDDEAVLAYRYGGAESGGGFMDREEELTVMEDMVRAITEISSLAHIAGESFTVWLGNDFRYAYIAVPNSLSADIKSIIDRHMMSERCRKSKRPRTPRELGLFPEIRYEAGAWIEYEEYVVDGKVSAGEPTGDDLRRFLYPSIPFQARYCVYPEQLDS